MSPLLKYVLLQVPGWVAAWGVLFWLYSHGSLSATVACLSGFVWVLKDFALYPYLRCAYEPPPPHGAAALIGERGRVRQRLDPEGMIAIHGELWRAETVDESVVRKGAEVRVEGAEGMLLFVRLATPGS